MEQQTQKQNNRKKVAIVVPMYKRDLSLDELISLRHLQHFLGRHDKFMIAPQGLEIESKGFGVKRFKGKYFISPETYSELLLSKHFYQAFLDYDYMLIYQIDCLVFSDQLEYWCNMGYDYIGAPFVRILKNNDKRLFGVGNGGLSLRKVKTFISVLDSDAVVVELPGYLAKLPLSCKPVNAKNPLIGMAKRFNLLNDVNWHVSRYHQYQYNEDGFWSNIRTSVAWKFFPGYIIAPIEEALRFSFEREPRFCFEQNGRKLPFGCHAWARYDRAFWGKYLLN